LRQQALNTDAIESERGFRIAKGTASRKIDAVVALAMACVGAGELAAAPLIDPTPTAEEREQLREFLEGFFHFEDEPPSVRFFDPRFPTL